MAVTTQQDFDTRPVGSDGAQQATQKAADLLAAGPFHRTQHGGDEPAITVKHDNGLKTVLVVMRVEQAQLLATVHGVKRVVNVERYAPGNLFEGFAIQIDHRAAHAQQRAGVRQVFQQRDRRLRTQIALRWSQIMRHLEDWTDAKGIGVVAVLMASRDHQQAETNDVGEPVRDQFGYARINDAGGQTLSNAKTLLDLAQDQNTGIRK
jgi:hypothetical protein